MSAESLQSRIAHETAELRAAFPALESCHSALAHWHDGERERYSLALDVRSHQRQSLVSGPTADSADAAVEAAFRVARARLEGRTGKVSQKTKQPMEEMEQ
jgi:hypothetical protein